MAFGKKMMIEDKKNSIDYTGFAGQQKIFYTAMLDDPKKKVEEINEYLANGWKIIYVNSNEGTQIFILEYEGFEE